MTSNYGETPRKRIKRNSDDEPRAKSSIYYGNINQLDKTACVQKMNIQNLLSKHGFDSNRNLIAYEILESFFEDFISYCEGGIAEIGLIELNDILKILDHHSMRQYFKHNIKKYCLFISIILEKLCDINLLLEFFHNEAIFHKTLISEIEYQIHFLDIEFPIILNILQKHEDSRLFTAVCGVMKKVIFNRNLGEFEKYLNKILGIPQDEIQEKLRLPKYLLKFIAATYKLQNSESSLVHKIVIQGFYLSCNDFSLIFKFFIVLIEQLGFDLSNDFEFCKITKINDSFELTKSLIILSDMLEIISKNKSELSCSVKICFSQFVENLVNSIVGLTNSPNKTCFKILMLSIEIHPLLVEKHLSTLIAYSMLSNNIECDEYSQLILKIFETYDKLHRIQNLISKMLPVLKCSIGNAQNHELLYSFRGSPEWHKETEYHFDIEKILPGVVLNYFSQCIVQMASWQVMNLYKTFLFHLEETVKDFTKSSDDNQKYFLELLCRFSSWLLRSLRMAENTATNTVLDNFNSAMGNFKIMLGKLGEALLNQEHNEKLVEAFLSVSHDWAEMYIIFHFYTRSYLTDTEIFCNINNPNYIHSFLSSKQWILIHQRITNFGESNCRHLMLKILVQKLRAMHIFGKETDENIKSEVLLHISTDLDCYCEYIISEKFILENLLPSLDSNVVLELAEKILPTLDSKRISMDIIDSRILSNGLIYTILSKISKILKSKSKYPFVRLFSHLNKEIYFEENDVDICIMPLKNIYEQFCENEVHLHEEHVERVQEYLIQLKHLPIPYSSTKIQCFLILCLFSLHKSCSENNLKLLIEKTIIGLLQSSKIDLINLFEPASLVKNVTLNFNRKCDIMSLISENLIKSEDSLKSFTPGISYLLDNLDICDNLQHSIVILKELQKVKKSKISNEFKDLCKKCIDLIIEKYFAIVSTKKAGMHLILPYVCCLRHNLSLNNDNLQILLEKMNDYIKTTLEFEAEILSQQIIALFLTILHNKQILKMPSNLPVRIWRYCKLKEVSQNDVQEFSQLLCLVFEYIPNEDFENVCEDLLNLTVESIQKEDYAQLSKHLTSLSYIVSSSFNPIKFKIWQQVLQKILLNLTSLKTKIAFNKELLDEIFSFEISIIQHNQLLVSPTMVGIFLMSPVFLLQQEGCDFYYRFNKCTDYMGILLKHRNTLIMDRLPTFLKVFRILLTNLCDKCGSNYSENSHFQLEQLADCGHQLEKLIRHLVLFKKDVARIAPHVIADILLHYERINLPTKVKMHLNNCLYGLISLCDQHAVSYLLRVLSNASTELFKMMFDNYKKFYRFTGKV
ncbi:hypothetical protein WA026_020565 [Henosepilachna vigintioctopunctata]|uniref:Nucleolar 27S pre-rRNA processing Urb2/Npa2 C-terminal domain-containing protein n=1 Tax=Henosepilachna vigintioctopunctata TaxID=420089 RepID=A0AAW1V4A6_9CUCU